MHDAAGRTEKLALLIQEAGGLPAGSVALKHMSGGVEAATVIIVIDGDFGFALLPHHKPPDGLSLHGRHTAEVGIERELVAPLHQLVKRKGFRAAVGVFGVINDTALEKELLPLHGIITLRDGGKLVAVTVHIGNFTPGGIHHGGCIPGVMVVACPVGRKAASCGGKLGTDGFFHHGEFHAGTPAHGVATADALHGAEFTQAHLIGIKKPDTGRTGHAENRGLGAKDRDAAGVHIHADSAGTVKRAGGIGGCEESGGLRTIKNSDTEALQLSDQGGLEGGAPDPEGEAVFIVIGEEKFCFLVPEFGTGKFILRVADFAPETLHIQKPVIALTAADIIDDAVAVARLLVHKGPGNLFRSHAGAGIGAGVFPVVEAGAGRA